LTGVDHREIGKQRGKRHRITAHESVVRISPNRKANHRQNLPSRCDRIHLGCRQLWRGRAAGLRSVSYGRNLRCTNRLQVVGEPLSAA
jgi:hypothetical protein